VRGVTRSSSAVSAIVSSSGSVRGSLNTCRVAASDDISRHTDDASQRRLGAIKSCGRPRGATGAHSATVRLGAQVDDALSDGTPLSYLVECWRSWEDEPRRDPHTIARKLRHAHRAATGDRAPRSTSPAVACALRRYHEHSARHRADGYLRLDADAQARRSAPAAYWASVAELLRLRVELAHMLANASRRPANTSHLERQAAMCRAHAERA